MIRRAHAALAGLAVLAALSATAGPAAAAEPDQISTLPGGRLQVTTTIAEDAELAGARLTLDGEPLETVAQRASSAGVLRSLALVVGTGGSAAELTSARAVVLDLLDEVPADVRVALVAPAEEAGADTTVLVAPTTDRTLLRMSLGSLASGAEGALDDAVQAGLEALGAGGARRLVLLAPAAGADAAASVRDTVRESGIRVDVLGDAASTALGDLARESGGVAVSGGDSAVAAAGARLGEKLAGQVVLTAAMPPGTAGGAHELTVAVGGSTSTRTVDIDAVPAEESGVAVLGGLRLQMWQVYLGVGLIGLGILGALLALLVRPRPEPTDLLGQQIEYYGRAAQQRGGGPVNLPAPTSITEHAQDLAARALANNQGLQAKVASRLQGADVDMRPAEWLPVHAVIGLVVGALGLLLTSGNLVGLILGLLLGLLVPWVILGIRQSRRMAAFQAQLAETLQLMAGSLQAGLSLAQSIDTIVREGSDPVAGEFRRAVVEARLGVDLEDSLEGIADRMQSKDFKWVVMAIRIQRQVGGNLAELLLNVAGTLREREYIRRHVRALSAEGRLSVYVLGGLPPVFMAYLALTNWDYVSVLFLTPLGWLMLGGMGVLLAVGVTWMTKVSKVAF
ncbi:hypothetical protein GCM10027425_11400 [Alteromonas gracilis]